MQRDSDVLAAAADDREERASVMTCVDSTNQAEQYDRVVNHIDDGSDVVEQPLAATVGESMVSSSTIATTACSVGGFDASAPPPFTIGELRAAIPAACWRRSTCRSLAFFLNDALIVSSLMAAAAHLDSPFLWPLYWLAQGTMFWALFVVGHDCGHGSFSDHKTVNHFVGHLTHTFVLVPYHGWRISHRNHHQNHGHAENDESWHPVKQSQYAKLHIMEILFRFTPLAAFGYPIYLWRRTPGKFGSHFHPDSPLFKPSERKDVLTSTLWWLAMIGLLMWFTFTLGLTWMTKLYFIPYLNFVMWLSIVTYLHHHGFEKKIPWYRGQEWSYLRGGLSTIDRDYGILSKLIHDIGTHVVHHLFPQIPHYHLVEATNFIKPILGAYYRQPKRSRPFPTHLLKEFLVSISKDHFVDDEGDIIFYK